MNCKSSLLFASVFLTLCGVSFAIVSDCGSVHGSINSVQISKCAPNARRCILKRGTNATMTINFTPNTASDSLKAVVHGVIMGVDIPFELPNPDGCKNCGITCPLQAGETYTYTTTMPVLGSYPRVTVDIKWELVDSEGKDVVCALITAKIN